MINASRLMLAAAAATMMVSCGRSKDGDQPAGSPDNQAVASSFADREDPCTLVTQAEAEKYLGPLAHAPFRADGPGDPAPAGDKCKYLGADGRYIYIEVEWTDGTMLMKAMGMMGSLVGQVFTDNSGKTDTLEGSWDEARWMGPGQFFAVKNDVMVTTDVSATRGGVAAAADLSSKALDRAGNPFAYDGAKAAAGAPRPRETGDACALLTAADLQEIGGSLVGAPVPSGTGTDTRCMYQVRTASGSGKLSLDVSWRRGFEHFAGNKMVMGAVQGQTAGMQQAHAKTGEATKAEEVKKPSTETDPGMQKMLGTLQKLAKTQGIQMDASGGMMHDTLIAGPWAEGGILGGVAFVAVKNDVQVSMGFTSLDIEQAKTLMTRIMGRL